MKVFKAVLLLVPLLLLFSLAHAVQKGGELDGTGTLTRMWDGTTDSNTSWIGTGGPVRVVGGELIMDFPGGTAYQYKYPIYNATSTNNISITIIGKVVSVGSTTELINVADTGLAKGCHLRCTGATTCYLRAENATKASNAANFAIEPDTYLNWTVERSQNATAMKCVLYRNGVLNQTVQDIKADATPYTIFYTMSAGAGSELRATEIWAELASGLTTTISSPTNTTYSSNNVELEYTADSDAPINYDCAVTIDGSLNTTYVVVDEVPEELTMTGLAQGAHNVNVNCFDGVTNATDTEWFTVDTVLELSLSSPANTTYTDSGMTVTYLPNTTAVVSEISCTVYFDGIANDTYTDLNNTQRTFDFTQLTEGAHNVTVNCGDGTENVTRAVHYTTSFELQLSITSPTNSTYMDSDLTLTYLPNTTYTPASSINCSVYFDGTINTTYVDINNTARSIGFRELNASFHNVAVNCGDGNENLTRTTYYTMDDLNFTLTNSQNATAYEGVTNFYNVTIGINPDIVSDVNASLYWNDTQIGYSYKGKRDLLTYWFNQTFMLPIVTTNNTSINTKWNVTKGYVNTSTYVENSSTSAQACFHAWKWDATTYSFNLIEGYSNDISVNLTKLGGVSDPINTSISALLVWNGSPSTMTATMNTSTKLGYSNTTTVPQITMLNATQGFNVTLNYSIDHGIIGYRSRIDTNTTYNYTQTIWQAWIGNCTGIGVNGITAITWAMLDEDTEGATSSSIKYSRIDVPLDEGIRTWAWTKQDDATSFDLCIHPYWGNYTGVNSTIEYARNNTNYDPREYYLVGATLDNSTDTVNLYNYDGRRVEFKVYDGSGEGYADSYIKLQRWYSTGAGSGVYRIIGMCFTDANGECSIYASVATDTSQVQDYYKVIIERDSLVKHTETQVFFVEYLNYDFAIKTITIQEGTAVNVYSQIYDTFNADFSYTNSSWNITFQVEFSDTSGLLSGVTLKITAPSLYGNSTIFEDTLTASSGTIAVNVGDGEGGQFTVLATGVYSGQTYTINSTHFNWATPTLLSESPDAVLAWLIITGTLMLIGVFNPTASIIMGLVGFGAGYALGLTTIAWASIVGVILVGILVIGVINRGSR